MVQIQQSKCRVMALYIKGSENFGALDYLLGGCLIYVMVAYRVVKILSWIEYHKFYHVQLDISPYATVICLT